MQNLENLGVFEILITQKLLKCPKDPFVRSALIYKKAKNLVVTHSKHSMAIVKQCGTCYMQNVLHADYNKYINNLLEPESDSTSKSFWKYTKSRKQDNVSK